MSFIEQQLKQNLRRWEVINLFCEIFSYKSYLEIGCDLDTCFNKINICNKIGVDPLRGGTHRMTSDDFFINNNRKFDIIFIDGLHHAQQVTKDMINSLHVLNANGIVLLHDTMPVFECSQATPIAKAREYKDFKGGWLGDCWKSIASARTDPNIDICTLPVETGISLVKKRANSNIIQSVDFNELNWTHYIDNKQKILNLIDIRDAHSWLTKKVS